MLHIRCNFIRKQPKNYAGHVVRMHIERCEKQLMFQYDEYHCKSRIANSFPSGTSAEI